MISRKTFDCFSLLLAFSLTLVLALSIGCGGGSSSSGNNGGGGSNNGGGGGGSNNGGGENPPANSNTNQWTWIGGSNVGGTPNSPIPGIYGTKGVAADGNMPGGRDRAVSWRDSSGNFWLFGGWGADSTGKNGYFNDLWEFNPTTNQWTWVDGASSPSTVGYGGHSGVYGTRGVPDANNIPGGRVDAIGWTDKSGNLWLFGGDGLDSDPYGSEGYLNDLWEFDIASRQWIWVGGDTTLRFGLPQPGIYGTQGISATTNAPGGRETASGWTDSNGNLWLFGGYGADSTPLPELGLLNDLWKFDPIAGTWTWIHGSSTIVHPLNGTPGIYGTQGTPSAQNNPGSREDANTWTDSGGNLWLFGGFGASSTGGAGELNDMWQFNAASQQWVWVAGSSKFSGPAKNAGFPGLFGETGIYGTQGIPSTENIPGSRDSFSTWTDSNGNLWLFGGNGFDSAGSYGYLNDLWKFNPSSKTWTWVDGSDTETPPASPSIYNCPFTTGVYGTQGTPSAGNVPGGRSTASTWIDSNGNLWMFGGGGADSTGTVSFLNDLWKFTP